MISTMQNILLAVSLLSSTFLVEGSPNFSLEKRKSAPHPRGAQYLGTWYMDCSASPESCNNLCYSRYCMQRNNGRVTWAPSMSTTHRTASGASDWSCPSGEDCDEWPAAALSEGGWQAILSCIAGGDNKSQ